MCHRYRQFPEPKFEKEHQPGPPRPMKWNTWQIGDRTKSIQTDFLPFKARFFSHSQLLTVSYSQERESAIESFYSTPSMKWDLLYSAPENSASSEFEVEVGSEKSNETIVKKWTKRRNVAFLDKESLWNEQNQTLIFPFNKRQKKIWAILVSF